MYVRLLYVCIRQTVLNINSMLFLTIRLLLVASQRTYTTIYKYHINIIKIITF